MALAALMLTALPASAAVPCDGIDRSLSAQDKAAFTPAILQQTGAEKVDYLDYFSVGSWRIIYVADYVSDEPFLFYSKSPITQHYLTMWGGAAMLDETSDIEQWALRNAPGIPVKLAACFAWYVTKGERK